MANRKINSILKKVKQYFGFLFNAEYDVRSVNYHPHEFGNWEVKLESDLCFIEICKDRTEILVYFLPLNDDRYYRIGLKAMIYYLSQGKHFIGPFRGNLFWGMKKQYTDLALLLRKYHDQIVPYFGVNFDRYRNELLQVERNYFMLAVKSIGERNRGKR